MAIAHHSRFPIQSSVLNYIRIYCGAYQLADVIAHQKICTTKMPFSNYQELFLLVNEDLLAAFVFAAGLALVFTTASLGV